MSEIITQTEVLATITRIILSVILLIFIVTLSFWQKLRLEKTFLISFIRGLIQVVMLGFILIFLFNLENIFVLFLYLLFMSIFAAYTTKKQYKFLDVFKIEVIAITAGGLGTMVFVTITGIIEPVGQYIIPMGGMVISNAMVMTTIVLERLTSDISKSKGQIEAALSLGDSPWGAVKLIIRDSYRAALLPSTNRVAVLGIVTILGLMSGMIIGGTNPIVAAVYQVIIFLMILSAGFISIIVTGYLVISKFFNDEDQLLTIVKGE